MSKNRAIVAAILMTLFMTYSTANAVPSGPFGYDLQADMHRDEKPKEEKPAKDDKTKVDSKNVTPAVPAKPTDAKQFYSFVPLADLYTSSVDKSVYYPNATVNSAIALYKKGNYTGCLQHLYSYIKKHPADAYAFYYMGMAYTRLGENQAAKNCYQKTINCNAKGKLLEQALKGRDCITGGIYCHAFDVNYSAPGADPLDEFINAPYTGNGFSPELEQQFKQQQLNNLQKEINRKDNLNESDMYKIQEIQNKSENINGQKAAMVTGFAANLESTPSNSEILDAIDVLKRAGVNITVGTTDASKADGSNKVNPADFMPSPEMQQLNMMLGNNNNNNSDAMMNMLPYMMNANNNGQQVDPKVIQSMMVNSMMNSINSMGNTDNK